MKRGRRIQRAGDILREMHVRMSGGDRNACEGMYLGYTNRCKCMFLLLLPMFFISICDGICDLGWCEFHVKGRLGMREEYAPLAHFSAHQTYTAHKMFHRQSSYSMVMVWYYAH